MSVKADSDSRVNRVIAAYLRDVDAGVAADPHELLRQNPEIADELRSFLDDQSSLMNLARAPSNNAEETTVAPSPAIEGKHFGEYELLAEVARGGMGVVYQARHVKLNRIVAVKMILSGQLADPADLKRFRAEAEAAASLDHPNIVPIYEVGEHEHIPYFSMKFIRGGSLSQRIGEFRDDLKVAARMLMKIARAVHYAHQRGLLHRDLKPGNILLDEAGRPHVTDFGLAKRVIEDIRLTQTGDILGTPAYMPPEQASAQPLTTAADVYSLGAILYEMLTGAPPFQAETKLALLLKVKGEDPPSPRRLNPHIDRDLETICLKCLEKEPSKRYASADALAEDLQHWLSAEPIRARPSTLTARGLKWARRRPALASLCALLIVTTIAGFTGVVYWLQRERAQRLIENDLRLQAEAARRQETEMRIQAEKSEEHARASELAAKNEQARAEDNAHTAAAEKSVSDQRLYVADVRLAQQAWLQGETRRVVQLLDDHLPKPGGADLRGFEWHYLRRLCTQSRELIGHSKEIFSLAFSPDGKQVASGSADNSVRIWDMVNTTELANIPTDGNVFCCAFSPNGGSLALGLSSGKAEIWDSQKNEKLAEFADPGRVIWSVAYSPDGKQLAIAGNNASVSLYDLASRRQIASIQGHEQGNRCVAFSPDGTQLAIAGVGVILYDLNKKRVLRSIHWKTEALFSVAFSPNGSSIATAGDDLRIWDVKSGSCTAMLSGHKDVVRSVAYSTDGSKLVSASWDCTVMVWSARGEWLAALKGHTRQCLAAKFSPTSGLIASAGYDHAVRLWPGPNEQDVFILKAHTQAITGLACASDESLITASKDGCVKVWNLKDKAPTAVLYSEPPTLPFSSIACGADGKTVLCAAGDAQPFVWNREKDTRIPLANLSAAICLAANADGTLFATANAENKIQTWRGDGAPLRTVGELTEAGKGMFFLGSSKKLAAFSGRELSIFDADTGAVQFRSHGDPGVCVASPKGDLLTSTNREGDITVWEVNMRYPKFVLKGHFGELKCAAFSPDGTRLASAGHDRTLRIWDLRTGQELLTFRPFEEITSLAFGRDGMLLAAGTMEGDVWLYDSRNSN